MKKISGIYKIVNKVNQKYYVGSSENMVGGNSRNYEHFYLLRNNIHTNIHLQHAWDKYGEKSFEFVIIERDISIDQLLVVEQKYLDIAKLESDKCYNINFMAIPFGRGENHVRFKRLDDMLMKEAEDIWVKYGKGKLIEFLKTKKCGGIFRRLIKQFKLDPIIAAKRKENRKKERTNSAPINMKPRYGKENNRFNTAIFNFYNFRTGETFIGTAREFYTIYNFGRNCVRLILSGKCKTINRQWTLQI